MCVWDEAVARGLLILCSPLQGEVRENRCRDRKGKQKMRLRIREREITQVSFVGKLVHLSSARN